MDTQARQVLITAPLSAQWLERLRNISPDFEVEHWHERSMGTVPKALWQEAEVLYTAFTTPLPLPEDAPRLQWVQLYSAGPDRVLSHPLFSTPVTFTTTSGIHAIPIAEYVLTMVLAWFHQVPQILEWQRRAAWPAQAERMTLFMGEELRGKTLGVVGYGSIGRELARLASAFGMRVLAMQRGSNRRDMGFSLPGIGDPAGALPDCYYTPNELHTMLGESDVVVLTIPLTEQTYGMFDEAAFQAMKSTAFLVNIARGDICDEAALLRALQERWIAGAALDVFHQEPLPPDHPFWHLPNIFVSPHSSGLTRFYDERAATVFEENLRRYLKGEPLSNIVDKALGY
jgi:phosphoglycerate dehydrogenase-like enzyme